MFVAFTPKGGCPLKLELQKDSTDFLRIVGSIHPQGWVPIETAVARTVRDAQVLSSIHPQGWVPIETYLISPRASAA